MAIYAVVGLLLIVTTFLPSLTIEAHAAKEKITTLTPSG
jgi:hypothetical protein